MAETEDSYASHSRSKVLRYPDRARYDFSTIHSILRASPVWHVSFVPSADDPFPTILPMIGAVGVFTETDGNSDGSGTAESGADIDRSMDLYIHGAAAARLLKLGDDSDASSGTSSGSGSGSGWEGIPLSICATLVDGYVLALTPMHHSMNYRSAVIHGYATLVTSPAERMWAMHALTNAVVPQRWENTRVPPTKSELKQTGILRVRIVSASAKVRSGGPGEDRRDEKDVDVRERVWTGVVPTWTAVGEPVPAEENVVEDLPEYLGTWRRGVDQGNRSVAERAVDG